MCNVCKLPFHICLQEKSSPLPDVSSEVVHNVEESSKESPPKVKFLKYICETYIVNGNPCCP